MPYVIDASNLGGVVGGARGSREAAAVLALLLPWARRRRQVVLVFDGRERPGVATRLGGVAIVWSGRRSADDVIVGRLGAVSVSTPDWTVVTEDVELARRALDLGARVERVSAFLARIASSSRPGRSGRPADASEKPVVDAAEVAHWREVFGRD